MSKIYNMLTLCLVLFLHMSYAQTGNDLWDAYKANPDNHPNIPNCSFAGYRTGNVPLPNPSVTLYNVKNAPYNAVGNGTTDDAPAIQAAINAAGSAGGGIVYIPTGTYLLNNFLHIKYSNVVLRGEGRDLTTLDFPKSLQTLKGDLITNGADYNWWWSGGLIWIGPGDTFDGSGNVIIPDARIQSWEYWRPGSVVTTVTATATRGAKTISVSNATGLSAGMKVLMTWENPSDKSLLKHVYGHAPTEGGLDTGAGGVGDCSSITTAQYPRFQWTVEIASVSGNQVTLVQPIRLDIRTNWNVRFEQLGNAITESGVENLRIKGHAQLTHLHLTKPTSLVGGWNGVYINRSWNCWTKNIAVTSMENGVILAAAKNVTVNSVLIDGPEQNHHSFACRVNSHDNLFEDFTVNGPHRARHGINTEWFSSGNVWSRGLQKCGTFDSHRALSFDLIRTECTVANDQGSVPGGASGAGPYIGRRDTHWNVVEFIDPNYTLISNASRNGDDIHEPKQYSMGALVGVSGKPLDTSEGENMPPGDKGTIVADDGATPAIINLYEAQKNFRAGSVGNIPPTVALTSPANNATFAAGANITINATAADSDGTIAKVEFFNGSTKLGEDVTSPYSLVWSSVVAGTYSLTAKATDNGTAVTTSSAISITVSPASTLRDPENPANTVNGLAYSYYEGSWTVLPDFSTLTPVKTGTVSTFDISPKNRGDQFAFKFTGYVNVPTDGSYTFYTASDDGSKLYIGTTQVVNNDGAHATQEVSGTIGLKAGKHAITVTFFEQAGGEVLTVSYAGPGITKTTIPASALYIVSTTNVAPSVSITSPVNNAVFTTGATVTINATATDTDGTVNKVEFFQGSTKLGEDTSSPYSFNWVTTTAGTYSLTAKATDNSSAVTTSTAITIQVNNATTATVYAINAGGPAFTAGDATPYSADAQFSGGTIYSTSNAIDNTTDDALYQTERYGNFTYALPVSANGNYDVTFKFAENYHTGTGQRSFDVKAEGITIISALDIFAAAGGKDIAYDLVKTVSVTDGVLNLEFITKVDNAKVSAIVVRNAAGGRLSTVEITDGMTPVIYPNPTTGSITIVDQNIVSVALYTLVGELVFKSKGSADTVDLSTLPAATYIIRVVTSTHVHTEKIIKK